MTKVKDLIEKLQTMNPEAIVTYAYGEYGRNTIHDFITSDDLIAVNTAGNVITDEEGEVVMQDSTAAEDEYLDEFPKNSDEYTWQPAIKLFAL